MLTVTGCCVSLQMFDNAFYSYATCGSEDHFSANGYGVEDALAGKTLRAALPATWHPFAFGYDVDGSLLPDWTNGMDIHGERLGMFPEFVAAVAESAGFSIEWVSISQAMLNERGGWEGCMADVSRGNLDLCVQAMYITPERKKLSQFTTPIDLDPVRARLVVEYALALSNVAHLALASL